MSTSEMMGLALAQALRDVLGREANPALSSPLVRRAPPVHPHFVRTPGYPPRFFVRSARSLTARLLLAREYRSWWRRKIGTPYGYCGCGCGRPTSKAGWTSASRGFVSGEPRAFLPYHAKRWGYPALTDPNRRCECGCGTLTPVVRDTQKDETGEPYEFASMRAKYLSRHHEPPPDTPDLTLNAPLGVPEGASLSELEHGWLAGVLDCHGSLVKDRGRLYLKVETTDEQLVRRFYETIRRGRVYVYQPGGEKTSSPAWYWRSRSSLEAANVFHDLYDLLLPETREKARRFLEETRFPVPKEPSEGAEDVPQEAALGWLCAVIFCKARTTFAPRGGARHLAMSGLSSDVLLRISSIRVPSSGMGLDSEEEETALPLRYSLGKNGSYLYLCSQDRLKDLLLRHLEECGPKVAEAFCLADGSSLATANTKGD